MIQSMTGFARVAGGDADAAWAWEVRSVNARGLDVRLRLPAGFEVAETAARAAVGERFKRGGISATLTVSRTASAATVSVNRPLLDQLVVLVKDVAGPGHVVDVETLLTVRGVVEAVDAEDDEASQRSRRDAVVAGFREAADRLAEARRAEGEQLAPVMADHFEVLARQIADADAVAGRQTDAFRRRLVEQVSELLQGQAAVPEERVAQEVALIAAKADVREELDRLRAHVVAGRELLADGEAVGRRLDFLCQELNREANTLCSKASDLDLTRIGLDMKATVERLREQVQNVE